MTMTHMHCMCIRVTLLLLLRCLRRQVRVQGRSEVSGGPEPIFDLLTIGTSGQCLNTCSNVPDSSFDEIRARARAATRQRNLSSQGPRILSDPKVCRDIRTTKTRSLHCSATRGTAPGPRNSRNSSVISRQVLMHCSSMRMTGPSGNALKMSIKVAKDKVLMHYQVNNKALDKTKFIKCRNYLLTPVQ